MIDNLRNAREIARKHVAKALGATPGVGLGGSHSNRTADALIQEIFQEIATALLKEHNVINDNLNEFRPGIPREYNKARAATYLALSSDFTAAVNGDI